jgi:hypothetical protein
MIANCSGEHCSKGLRGGSAVGLSADVLIYLGRFQLEYNLTALIIPIHQDVEGVELTKI